MIEVYYFDKAKDQIKKSSIDNLSKEINWIRVVDLNEEKINILSKYLDIPNEELRETLEEEERPKISVKKYLEIIYRAPYYIDDELETLPIYFYLFHDKIVTIEKKPLKIIDLISQKMELNKTKFLFKKGLPYFIYYIIDKINDDFLSRIDKIGAKMDIYENFSKKEMTVKDVEKIYDQSVALSFFNQALLANLEVLNTLKKGYFRAIPKKDNSLFEEAYYDVLQIIDTEKIQRESVANLINVHSIITSTRLNEFMKRLTVIALIMAVPTMLSGLYGMNFIHIPFRDHPYGFYITTVMIFIFTYSVYYFLTKRELL
ncbi:magnesium transporter CorA family protein [archaeon]|jgi:magnesium transporter|nr:magnesium transporter CorA family protein [archaeon]MBT4022699.1 magnesium transporter CorA family protein [archaeon]MBT4273107.1 magnesium transporter CorA family protein [archaeon]MBT4461088.1 magnesium transporter CorA family protein [archaeon]MBT4858757.1 magnesium transporter CorA family protein [archaeon]